MRAQLVPIDGSAPIEIVKDLVVVGRREDCDLRLDHKSVSKIHCVLVRTDGLLMLRDLGSTNGTRVNGTRVRRAALLPNDHLSIASYKFRVHLGPDMPSHAPESVHASEQTQHLDAKEVAELLRKAKAAEPDDEESSSDASGAAEPLHRNQLPDVYAEERSAET